MEFPKDCLSKIWKISLFKYFKKKVNQENDCLTSILGLQAKKLDVKRKRQGFRYPTEPLSISIVG